MLNIDTYSTTDLVVKGAKEMALSLLVSHAILERWVFKFKVDGGHCFVSENDLLEDLHVYVEALNLFYITNYLSTYRTFQGIWVLHLFENELQAF
jgi:hypothetical protein